MYFLFQFTVSVFEVSCTKGFKRGHNEVQLLMTNQAWQGFCDFIRLKARSMCPGLKYQYFTDALIFSHNYWGTRMGAYT